jgi:alpha-methylacyl-CoA racemase
MVLSDLGAEVIRLDRATTVDPDRKGQSFDLLARNRSRVGIDLKHPGGKATALALIDQADALIEGFRPGVMERLGLGPGVCLERNSKLVFGRMTGWGQDGPYAQAAGHDINYIALAGVLHGIGEKGQKPTQPLNLVGDFGGGGMLLALGVVCGILEAARSGQGQVVDAAMVDGSALLSTIIYQFRAEGRWEDERGSNFLDTGAPFYGVYETADGEFVSIGALEPQFYAELVRLAGVDDVAESERWNKAWWPGAKERFEALFKTKTRAEWCELLEQTDVCFAPVLSMEEASQHPQNVERDTFVEVDGVTQPAPAPRFERTPGAISRAPTHAGANTDQALAAWGLSAERIAELREAGAIA